LGFRGVIQKKNTLVGTRGGTGPGHALAAADDAGLAASLLVESRRLAQWFGVGVALWGYLSH